MVFCLAELRGTEANARMQIAVLIPCYNEEQTIEKVIRDFQHELPDATIYVYDNNSKDKTADVARQAGAIVKREPRQGKGNVVRSMFRDIDADVYVMADGDDTYPAEFVHDLMKPVVANEADMTIGDRHTDGSYESENKRPFHNLGNHMVKSLINQLFKSKLRDIMTGYRVFNRRFAKTMPVNSEGFEIETEMTLHALDKRFRILEIPITYRDRPPGSESKLNTVSDGARVLKAVFWIFKDYKPLAFFCTIALALFILGLVVGIPVVTEFFQTGKIAKMPSAILAVGLMVLATNALTCGFILDTIVRNHRDNYELFQNQYR